MNLNEAREKSAQCWCDRRVQDREMDAELAEVFAETLMVFTRGGMTKSALNEAVRECCTCGGKGPRDEGVCPACEVWHLMTGRGA